MRTDSIGSALHRLALFLAVPALAFLLALAPASAAEISVADLPPEARETLALIRRGGPFPHAQDGTVFGNREHLLPAKERAYYHEYTVRTPGARDRGARRIIAGGEPRASRELYYTDDHYRSFRRIRE